MNVLMILVALLFGDPCLDPNMYGYFSPETGLYIKCSSSNTIDYTSSYNDPSYNAPASQLLVIDDPEPKDPPNPFRGSPYGFVNTARWRFWESTVQKEPVFAGIVGYKEPGCYANAAKPQCFLAVDDPVKGYVHMQVTPGTWNRAWLGGYIGLCGPLEFGWTSTNCRHYRLNSASPFSREAGR